MDKKIVTEQDKAGAVVEYCASYACFQSLIQFSDFQIYLCDNDDITIFRYSMSTISFSSS